MAAPPGCESAARRFYGDLLGLVEAVKPEPLRGRGGVWFRIGPQQLHIGVETPFFPARKAHPGLRVSSVELDAVAERLAEAGAKVAWDHDLPGVRRLYTEDPWGNRLELLAAAIGGTITRSAAELERSGRHLAEVLALAEALPFRREEGLRFPRLPVPDRG
jgi:catechol 2,3-dioxygenase-like lactoylglutathione lyase family enzyme